MPPIELSHFPLPGVRPAPALRQVCRGSLELAQRYWRHVHRLVLLNLGASMVHGLKRDPDPAHLVA